MRISDTIVKYGNLALELVVTNDYKDPKTKQYVRKGGNNGWFKYFKNTATMTTSRYLCISCINPEEEGPDRVSRVSFSYFDLEDLKDCMREILSLMETMEPYELHEDSDTGHTFYALKQEYKKYHKRVSTIGDNGTIDLKFSLVNAGKEEGAIPSITVLVNSRSYKSVMRFSRFKAFIEEILNFDLTTSSYALMTSYLMERTIRTMSTLSSQEE